MKNQIGKNQKLKNKMKAREKIDKTRKQENTFKKL